MSHDAKFAEHRARREAERAAEVKVTWRKVSPDTGGGWSGLGPEGRLVFARAADHPTLASRFAYGFREGQVQRVMGATKTLAQAKRAAEALFTDDPTSDGDAVEGTEWMRPPRTFVADRPGKTEPDEPTSDERRPARNLRVVKKHVEGRRYVAAVVDYSDPAGSTERRRATGVGYPTVFRAHTPGWNAKSRAECEDWINDAPTAHERSTMTTSTIPTAESLIEGIGEATAPTKAPYVRLQVDGKTVAYCSTRKDGVLLDFATSSVEGAPAKFQKVLEGHGTRTTMRVTAKSEKLARALLERLAKK